MTKGELLRQNMAFKRQFKVLNEEIARLNRRIKAMELKELHLLSEIIHYKSLFEDDLK